MKDALMERDSVLWYTVNPRTLCWLWLLTVMVGLLNFITWKEFKVYLFNLRWGNLTKKRWANVLQITPVENPRGGAKTQICYLKKSGAGSLQTSYHLALRFHFPHPQTSCLPPDPSVSPLRNFPRSSTPNCLPDVNQFPNVVSSWCPDFS